MRRICAALLSLGVACTNVTPAAAPAASATQAPSAAPSSAPVTVAIGSDVKTPNQANPDSYFRTVAEYEYVSPPSEVQALINFAFNRPEITRVSSGVSVKLVTHGDDPGQMLVVVVLLPSYAGLPGLLDGIGSGITSSKPTPVSVGGHPALLYTQLRPKILAWIQRQYVAFLYGDDPAAMLRFAGAAYAANQDATKPVTTVSLTPSANSSGWRSSDVTVTLTAVDEPGGSA